jgi:hypothetical protein
MTGPQSGILVYGEQRGAAAADFNEDGRMDLAVTQNGAPTRLFTNQSAPPGIRVQLIGSATNPSAIGAKVRWTTAKHSSPVQEIHSGSGYGSADSALLILAAPAETAELIVQWPGGKTTAQSIQPSTKSLRISQP